MTRIHDTEKSFPDIKFSKKKVNKVAKKLKAILETKKNDAKKKELEPKKTGRRCANFDCKGEIIQTFVRKFDSRHGPMIIGPGSKGQYRIVSEGFSCETCGLMYKKLPLVDLNENKKRN